jgi:hypothetical protein
MVTYKSLVVSFALILALACAGMLATSAHTVALAQKQHSMMPYQNGIAAISLVSGKHKRVSFQDVRRYVKAKGFVGGPTLTGQAPTLKALQLTSILHLDSLLYSLLAQMPGNKQVYFARLEGPFLVLPQLPLPVLCTLLPSVSNLPAFIPHLSNLSSLGLFNTSPLFGLLPGPHLTLPHKLPGLPGPRTTSSLAGLNRMPDLSNAQSSSSAHLKSGDPDTVLASAYEVFDAENGNLLAWG